MNSAIGNFDSSGMRMAGDQTPENDVSGTDYVENITVSKRYLKMLQTAYDNANHDATSENVTIDALKYVSKEEFNSLCALCAAMLANGATLFELQQRIMGWGTD